MSDYLSHTAAVAARYPEQPEAVVPDRFASIIDVHVILRRADRVLLLRRTGDVYASGQLCLPSGHLEQGESACQAAAREAFEETGITLDPAALRHVLSIHQRNPGTSDTRVGFDSWALAWICPVPVIRIWIESDLPSRTRKCLVSLGDEPRPLAECEGVLRSKDDYNRAMFRRRHGFDLFTDRERYHAVLCNSHLIPAATRQESRRGIEEFAPVVRDTALAIMSAEAGRMAELRAGHPREVHAVRLIHAGVA